MITSKSLLLVAVAALSLSTAICARAGVGPISMRVEQPSSTTNEGDKKTVKRNLKIIFSNSSAADVDIKIKYVLFGRDASEKEVKAVDNGDRGATVKARGTEVVETTKATAIMTDAKTDPKTRKRTPAAGVKFVGYGIQVSDKDGKLLTEAYDPATLKESWSKVVAAPAPK
ncbi:MAG: hypothetical protein K8R23_17610 [Chthoniobacter sp.]|nr:hypothetical protein [Chthoniobacter sp.]